MTDLVNISIPTAAGYAVLGYLVVFLGLVMLMCVIFVMGRVMHKETPKAAPAAAAPVEHKGALGQRVREGVEQLVHVGVDRAGHE